MDLKALQTFSRTVVFIDDGFAPPDLALIQEEHWGVLRREEDIEAWRLIKNDHFQDIERPVGLMRDEVALRKAWDLYKINPIEFRVLDPIFQHVFASQDVQIRPLIPIIDFLRDEAQLDVRCHPNIQSALVDIMTTKFVFLDFYLNSKDAAGTIEEIRKYKDIFGAPVKNGEHSDTRFIFLISTALPPIEVIEEFRKVTNVKSAFFCSVPKQELTRTWLEQYLQDYLHQYPDLQRLSEYMDIFSQQIQKVSDDLRGEIDSIEIHDLTILNSMRLEEDSGHLGNYLSWIISEALAAKIRRSDNLLKAAGGVSKIQRMPFQGTLTPKTVLFDLYSEILFSPVLQDGVTHKMRFGDVYVPKNPAQIHRTQNSSEFMCFVRKTVSVFAQLLLKAVGEQELPETLDNLKNEKHEEVDFQECILVIAPACDLQRCLPNYDVLCVKGKMLQRAADLSDLLSQKSLYGNTEEGIKHLYRRGEDQCDTFTPVVWNPKEVTTIKWSRLQNTKYYTIQTTLNELFAQEVKEAALRQFGRIGVPVDPSFSGALGASFKLSASKKLIEKYEVQEQEYIAGIFVSANEYNRAKISLSEQFLKKLSESVEKICAADSNALNANTKKLLASLQGDMGQALQLEDSNSKQYTGGLVIRFVNHFERDNFTAQNEIVFYPRGKISDKSNR